MKRDTISSALPMNPRESTILGSSCPLGSSCEYTPKVGP